MGLQTGLELEGLGLFKGLSPALVVSAPPGEPGGCTRDLRQGLPAIV
ncbi:MAG: hypothetical protein NTX42_06675 [Methanothrix sp.]|nr:hypothetical protein [Methanothrix sp.]